MKLIFTVDALTVGGVEMSFESLIRYLDSKQFEIELHLLNQQTPLLVQLPDGVKIKNVEHSAYDTILPLRTCWKHLVRNRKYGLILKKICYSILTRLKISSLHILAKDMFRNTPHCECDVCFVLKENTPALLYAARCLKHSKMYCFFHTAAYFQNGYKHSYYKYATKIITVSQGNRDFLFEKMPKLENKILVIHNIVNPEYIRELAGQPNYKKSSTFNIVSVCRIDKEKGIDKMIQSCRLLLDNGFHTNWVIVGPMSDENGEYYNYCVDLIETYNLQKHFVFAGYAENPYPYLEMSDVYVNASDRESFGIVIREAQILGKLVVATDTYGSRELIEDKITGIIVKNDSEDITNALQLLINDEKLRNSIKFELKNRDFDETKQILDEFRKLITK